MPTPTTLPSTVAHQPRVDWLTIRAQADPRVIAGTLVGALHPGEPLATPRPVRPHNGFSQALAFTLDDGTPLGTALYGGASQRGWVHFEMSGIHCAGVNDQDRFAEASRITRLAPGASIVRLDLALDLDCAGITVDTIRADYDAGCFDPPRGRRPLLDVRDPRRGDVPTGWTVYVGKRGQAQFLCIYDKTAERISALGAAAANVVPIDVHRVRAELRMQRTADREVPWDALVAPSAYLAGHSDWLAHLTPSTAQGKRFTYKRATTIADAELTAKLTHARQSYGHFLYVARQLYSDADLLAMLVRYDEGTAVRFAALGAQVEHDAGA